MRLLVIAHDHASPTGPIGERFHQRGYDLATHLVVPAERHRQPDVTTLFPRFTEYDAVLAMGAPWSVYDDEAVGTWVHDELDQLRQADEAGVPVLGICFGGQLLARAHGGSVVRSEHPEIGWAEVDSDRPDLVAPGPWFEWHYDTWTLPARATEIARNPQASQAFTLRRNLAVQFHPELTSAGLAGWFALGGATGAERLGHQPQRLLEQTAQVDGRSRARAHALVDGFLDVVAQG